MLHCNGDDQIELDYEMERIKNDIILKLNRKENIVLLLHPTIMKLYDNLDVFKEIVKTFKEMGYKFVTISQLVDKISPIKPLN
tara:strand:+ start:545 stop:793 length:249 start_codon:yes stop_codon:yes gene_type:complete